MANQGPTQAARGGAGGGGGAGAGAGAQAAPVRSLRVGVALGDHFIDERLFRSRENITIGQSAKNTFSIPVENLPKSWQLFTVENGRYLLHFTERMDGRLSDGQNVFTFDSLKGRGAEKRGDHWVVPLVESSRGKVELGQMKLLFQFVTAPPVQPRPRLPASVRGTLADRVDPMLAVIMAISILIHFAIALYAMQYDRQVYSRTDQIYREFQNDTFRDKVIATTVEVAETGTEATTTEQGGNETPTPRPTQGSGGPKETDDTGSGDDDGAPDDATIQEALDNSPLLSILGGGEDPGGRYGKMNETDQGASLDKALENAKGKNIASIGSGGGRKTRGPDTGKIGSGSAGGEVKGPGSGKGTVGPKVEEKVSRTSFTDVDDLAETTLDPDAVAKIIRSRYLQGIKRCHERVLKQDPSARGRVTVKFTVGPTGGVTKSSVKGFDPTVDSCIKGLTSKWRFGAPKDDDGKPTSAEFQIPFMLEPG